MASGRNALFQPAKKGHSNGIVDEGNSLRQKFAFRAEFVKNTKLAKNRVNSRNPRLNISLCSSRPSW